MTALAEALAALPPDADEIAELFRELEIKGYRIHACACPMAVYLSQETGADVAVGWWTSSVPGYATTNPAHVETFTERFDGGAYPWLRA